MKRSGRQLHHVLRTAAVCLLVCALLLTSGVPGRAVDLSRDCSVALNLGGGEFADTLRETDLVVDLYQIAGAAPRDGEDAFDFHAIVPYDGLELAEIEDQAHWNAVARQAMQLALERGTPIASDIPAEQRIDRTNGGEPLAPGLYLLLVHGRDETELAEIGEDGAQATVAYAGAYRYLFAPLLVSLPTKEADGDGAASTAGQGEWIYDATVYCKAERENAYGALRIVKTLRGCDAINPAVFLFSVEAVLGGETVYSDVLALSFDAAGEQSVLIDRIPIGATVTVTECYSGVGYQLVTEPSVTITLEAPTDDPTELQTVVFVNDFVGSPNGFGSIDNAFSYSEDDGWSCTQIPLD